VKYFVRIGGERHEVILDGDGVHIDGDDVAARVLPIDGTPMQMVTIGNEVHRVVVRRGEGRGEYTLWFDGYRFEVEALDERTHAIRELSGASAAAAGPAPVVAPMPGLIVRERAGRRSRSTGTGTGGDGGDEDGERAARANGGRREDRARHPGHGRGEGCTLDRARMNNYVCHPEQLRLSS